MNDHAIKQSLLVLDAHIDALNNRDAKALANTLHFPHHRLSGSHWKTWETAERYFEDFLNRAGSEWSRSSFTNTVVLASTENKVHLDVEVSRYDSNDSVLTRFKSLWIIVEIDGIWAAKVRSSFATR